MEFRPFIEVTIALSLQRDTCRAWQEPSAPLSPEFASELDVERESLARVELAIVADAIRRLSPNHRAVLLAELGARSSR